MNTEDDNNTVDMDQDAFEAEFFNPTAKQEEVEEPVEEVEEVAENEDDSLATENDNDEDEVEETEDDDEDSEDSDEEAEEEEVEETPKPKQKRNRAQERIEKLVAEARQAERERDALRIELERIRAETTKEEPKSEKSPALRENLPSEAPDPDALDENGDPIYELGEFDKKYIRDITKWTIEQETKAAKEQAEKEAQAAQIEAAQEEIRNKWIENLDKAEAEEPEIRENIRTLAETFQDVEPVYGEYLASTIMASDYGPQIMNYLSQNIGEAQKIVASGPAAATLALGRLEARFITSTQQEEKRNTPKVSKAPAPPEARARGANGRFAVPDDTDDQDAFERVFFK